MADIPQATLDHYQYVQKLQALAVAASRRAWSNIDPARISETWLPVVQLSLAPVITAAQVKAATSGASYSAMTLAEQGTYAAPEAFVDPTSFGGYAADGRSLNGLLAAPAYRAKSYIGEGMAPADALRQARGMLDTIARSTVNDAARQSASVDIAARPKTGYVRMLNPPSCSRCTVLAGRFYKWNKGFQRHPGCDCVHVASNVDSQAEAFANGLIDDPQDYFDSLSEADQDKVFGKSSAEAIRDGADMGRVENAKLGRNGMTTTVGTGSNQGRNVGTYGKGFAENLKGRRLTPDGIYAQAGSREEALTLLREHGYISEYRSPVGRDYEGFGQMGHGGDRRGATAAVNRAQARGMRDATESATMTAAERRFDQAVAKYNTAISNPGQYSPVDMAEAESALRAAIARAVGDVGPQTFDARRFPSAQR